METHEVSVVFGNDGRHVVVPELARNTGHGFEGVDAASIFSINSISSEMSIKNMAR